MRVLRASLPPSPCSLPNTTPAPNCTNNLFHALENDDDNDTPGATTWSPPPLLTLVPQTLVQCAQVTPFQQAMPTRLVFDDIASPSVPNTTPPPPIPPPLPRVSETPSPVAHCTRSRLAPLQHSSLMELVQYHIPTAKTTQPQNILASQFAGLCQAMALSEPEMTELTVSAQGFPLSSRDTDCGPGSKIWPITQALPSPKGATLQRSVGPLLF